MRLLIAGPLNSRESVEIEINAYRDADHFVTVNTHYLAADVKDELVRSYASDDQVTFCTFDPARPEALKRQLVSAMVGYDAVIYPPDLPGFTPEVIDAAVQAQLAHPLQIVGCPNDVVRHLSSVEKRGIKVLNASDIHASSVGEYTMGQIANHARRLAHFHSATGENGAWPHDEATTTTRTILGKTIGIIGVTGKDGRAVATYAQKMGLRILGLDRDGEQINEAIRGMGIERVSLEQLLRRSDFISINAKKDTSLHLIGGHEIDQMKRGVIIVNPAGAEIIEKGSLLKEYAKPHAERTIGALILDMPYGGRKGAMTFAGDPANATLKSLGVFFTPRMAGYSLDTYTRGVEQVAQGINRHFARFRLDRAQPVNLPKMASDILALTKAAGARAIELRRSGLHVRCKQDGSPWTNADMISEQIIRDGLRKRYAVTIIGEELGSDVDPTALVDVIIDGIDGTRNFRDGNYGWCTSACVTRQGQPLLAVVHDPTCGETFWAVRHEGAFHNDSVVTQRLTIPSCLPSDFSFSIGSYQISGSEHIRQQIASDINALGGRQREWGCIALSMCHTALGGLGVFIQGDATPQDYLAGYLIAEEAGAALTRLPSRTKNNLEDIIVAHPTLNAQIATIYAKHFASERAAHES